MYKETNKTIYSYRPEQYGHIKDAVTELIAEAGGIERVAALCRVSTTMLSHYANLHHEDKHMPVDVAITLEAATGCLAVSNHLAAQHQAVIFQYPRVDGHRNWLVHLAHTTEKFSNVAALGAKYLTQGDLNAEQRAEIRVGLEKLMEKLAILHMALTDEDA